MKKLNVIFLILILIVLSACVNVQCSDAGMYYCAEILSDGVSQNPEELFSLPPVLELKADGSVTLQINGAVSEGTWSNDNGDFTLNIGNSPSHGKLEGGSCTVELFGNGLTYCFSLDRASVTETHELSSDNERNNKWSGDWYGFWRIGDASGIWESIDGQRFDCFAEINMGLDGHGDITLWDEKSSRQLPMAKVQLVHTPSENIGYGIAESESGFFFERNVEEGDWVISPDDSEFENFLVISSVYESAEGNFTYEVYLRPWGYLWDDLCEYDNAELPYYYSSFYVPMVREKKKMPDYIGTD